MESLIDFRKCTIERLLRLEERVGLGKVYIKSFRKNDLTLHILYSTLVTVSYSVGKK